MHAFVQDKIMEVLESTNRYLQTDVKVKVSFRDDLYSKHVNNYRKLLRTSNDLFVDSGLQNKNLRKSQ